MPPPPAVTASPDLVKSIQRELRLKNYEVGAEDGSLSIVTRAAIMAYEADQSLPLTAEPKETLLQHMILGGVGGSAPKAASTGDLPASAADVVREVQRELKRVGHDPGPEDARLSETTIRAIRSFETAENMTPKGRISGELLAKLKSAPAKQASR